MRSESRGPSAAPVDVAPSSRAEFPIVGIGASAGGLEALRALIGQLSRDGMAFVVVQHLAPDHASLLPEIQARSAPFEVVSARDGARVKPNTIYVGPPDAQLSIAGGVLHLAHVPDRVPRRTIDAFFRSLASDAGRDAIGIVLSGAGSDGTLGLRAIKQHGGLTFAQEPSTAEQASMPQSALSAGCADFCMSPDQIAGALMNLAEHREAARSDAQHHLDVPALRRIFDRLRRAHRVDFAAYKLVNLERSVERRMSQQKLDSIADYVKLVESSPDEVSALCEDVLVGTTSFFRDGELFQALDRIFQQLLQDRAPEDPVRIWVPGCSTGQEAYSIAICLLEHLDRAPASFPVQIFGTDLNEGALKRARRGRYPHGIERDVSAERLQRFFVRSDEGYQVSPELRDTIIFTRHDLGRDPPFSRVDLVSCRNVLIYMQPALQRKLLSTFHYALKPGGFLVLGTSESVAAASQLFSCVDRKLKIFSKKNARSPEVLDFVSGPRGEALERRKLTSLQQLADRRIVEKFGPPGILVNEHLDVIEFRGDVAAFLAPGPGAATLNVTKLVRPELLPELRATLERASSEGVPMTSERIPVHIGTGESAVVIEVMPLIETGSHRGCYLLLFRTLSAAEASEPSAARPRGKTAARRLAHELLVTKEYLHTVVQELEAANEELASSNEELRNANHELQTTNEELETSREELRSTNEELSNVNAELRERMRQLGVANDDLQNLVSLASIAFVMVDMDLRIRRFSLRAEKSFGLVPADVGRPIGFLAAVLGAPHLGSTISESINEVRERSQQVRGPDGRSYLARVVPCRNAAGALSGAFIELSEGA